MSTYVNTSINKLLSEPQGMTGKQDLKQEVIIIIFIIIIIIIIIFKNLTSKFWYIYNY